VLLPELLYSPTTLHCVVLMHDTPVNSARVEPEGTSPTSTFQAVPSHFSATGFSVTLAVGYVPKPTARQNVALRHDIPSISESTEAVGLGMSMCPQAVPFQTSASGTM
jgi:hypothetical protein